jgi:SAM-dependent methyltransferase
MRGEFQHPPARLAARIGGRFEDYAAIASGQRDYLVSILPDDWSFKGKTVLDFGCGPGRTLSSLAPDVADARFLGCDIHEESIVWANENLSPPCEFFVCGEKPPLAQPDGRFDLVYAFSVFTHITHQWGAWMAEVHRLLAPRGLAVISVLGPAMAKFVVDSDWDWDERIGMAILDTHKGWEVGGPNVLLSEWWVREHWGRAFDVVSYQQCDPAVGAGHDMVLLRRREVAVHPQMLIEFDAADKREQAGIACNLEILLRGQERLGDRIRDLQADLAAAQARENAVATELAILKAECSAADVAARTTDSAVTGTRLRRMRRFAGNRPQ